MPIRLNLLAEQIAAEEVRRRDPVKRATWVASLVIALLLTWGGYRQFQVLTVSREINRHEEEWLTLQKDYQTVSTNLNRTVEALQKREALIALSTNRPIWAPTLNALQYTWVDQVELSRLKIDQSYALGERVKPSTNSAGVVSKGRPPTSREKVLLTLDARDFSAKPGDQIFQFQERLNTEPYFKSVMEKIELTGRSQPQSDPSRPNHSFVQFTLECRYPERIR